MFTFLLTVVIVCDSRLRCGLHPYSSCLETFFELALRHPFKNNPATFSLEPFTSEVLPLHRAALRGTLFIQNSSLLWTLASKSLSCLNRFLWKCVLFRKQNATTKGSYCWLCLACTQKTLVSKCHPTHSDESIIPRLRHFPPTLSCTLCIHTFRSPEAPSVWMFTQFRCCRRTSGCPH